ncbi:P-loop containing nucleoside triphosphate hydrolase protein [Serendipita vermifera]|nr:P-loop containing nucleoside triphosphate hydrolase protein [Serendipita vermifera]
MSQLGQLTTPTVPAAAHTRARKSEVSSLSSMSQDSIDDAPKKLTKMTTRASATTTTNIPRPATTLSTTPYKPPKASLQLLFTLFTKRDMFFLVLPAVLAALAAASIPPFMTIVVGDAFDVFSAYQSTPNPTQHDKDLLLKGLGLAAIEFCAMGGGALFLSGVMSALWIWVGEKNIMYIRRAVYDSVTGREMEWFDKNTDEKGAGDNAVGAGGLMTQFASATEDVRIATALNMGMMVQYSCTILATLIMAFQRSALLALVTLSTIPALVLVQALSQRFSFQYYTLEQTRSNSASTIVDRAINAISTVKAFNAQDLESARLNFALDLVRAAGMRCASIWSLNSTFNNFIIFAMFVQGFWFGAKLVAEDKLTTGDVLSVFWACLIAASTMQSYIVCAVSFARGKASMVTLMNLITPPPKEKKDDEDKESRPMSYATNRMSLQPIMVKSPKSGFFPRKGSILKPIPLQGIRPTTCNGEFQLSNITFAYPSRPTVPVLSNVSLFFPAGEMTFVVGGSGSGKSTLAQLLLRLYEPQDGAIEMDSRSFNYLDEHWTRGQIAAVSQGQILFDGSVHENVALGVAGRLDERRPSEVTREEVVAACRVALMHDFVRDLPDGYDTKLGNGGAALSGGQKQRLSIARAYMRDPTVLILDEATSALDGTSRLLVFEAIKHWRRNRTTIVITHDLSQIGPDDFVYVLKEGSLVEQGFRQDLEADSTGEFYQMAETQGMTGGFLPAKDNETAEDEQVYERDLLLNEVEYEREGKTDLERKHRSALNTNPTLPSSQAWMYDAVQRLHVANAVDDGRTTPVPFPRAPSRLQREVETRKEIARPRRKSLTVEIPDRSTDLQRRSSLQFTPSSAYSSSLFNQYADDEEDQAVIEDDDEFEAEKQQMERTAADAQRRRVKSTRRRWDVPAAETNPAHRDHKKLKRLRSQPLFKKGSKEAVPPVPPLPDLPISSPTAEEVPQLGFFTILRIYWPTIPHKFWYIVGLFFSILVGICTPIFGFFLSQLLAVITNSRNGFHDTSTVSKYGSYVLLLAIGNGLANGIKYFLIEWVTMDWVRSLRKDGFDKMIKQDKSWFDISTNVPSNLLQLLMRDTDDAKAFLSMVLPQTVVVTSMIGTGLIWALVQGWQLTLVGLALGPIFVGFSSLQNHFSGKFERRNKERREDVNKKYYDTVANVRAIRSMGFDGVFKDQFERSLEQAMKSGVDGGFINGMAFGIANALIYLAQGLIYYVGAVLIAKGLYSFLQMMEVLNLVAFSLTIGAQMLYFVQRIHKSLQAMRDFKRILALDTKDTQESQGTNRWRVQGPIRFHDISFAYPSRPEVTVLRNMSLKIKPNECVALVGASGSGKSTIAALLQRLYEPTSGFVSINGHRLHNADVVWLREHVAVVSQHPHLFAASVEDNIGYGGSTVVPREEIERAAKEANIHDFIMSLPEGYETFVGENASLISGGQAQRISIARALVRKANLLILDECTSALDAENQREVMNTIQKAKNGRTTLIVTHKLAMMQMADRILVMEDGGIAEEGSYSELMQRRGVFYKLATAGEWEGAD